MDYRSNLFNRWRTGSNLCSLDHCSYLIFAYRGDGVMPGFILTNADPVAPKLCENQASGFHPQGLSDSSRWSQRSADHRKGVPTWTTPGESVEKSVIARQAGV